MAHLLIRFTTAPYSVSQASDGLDFAMAATNYGHEVSILFEGDGIYQLTEQAPQQQGVKNHFKGLKRCHSLTLKTVTTCSPIMLPEELPGGMY